MKKALVVFIVILAIILSFSNSGSNNEGNKNDEFDKYVYDNFNQIAKDFAFDTKSLSVSQGIEIVGLRYPNRIYPIYENGKLEYALELYCVDEEIGYAFPGNTISLIEKVFELNESEFSVFAIGDSIYASVNDVVISFRTNESINKDEFNFDVPEQREYQNKTVEFNRK